jgi:Flp pilus assembly pilin Flp
VLILRKLRALAWRCEGQDLIEYGLLVGMISAAVVASIAQIAPKVSQPFATIAAAGNPASGNPGNGNPGNSKPVGNAGNGNPGNGSPGNSTPGNGN